MPDSANVYDDLAKGYRDLTQSTERNSKAVEHLQDVVTRLAHVIDGNGGDGMRVTLALAVQELAVLKQSQTAQRLQSSVDGLAAEVRNMSLSMVTLSRDVLEVKTKQTTQESDRKDAQKAFRTWVLSLMGLLLVALTGFVWNTWNVKDDLAEVQRALKALSQQGSPPSR